VHSPELALEERGEGEDHSARHEDSAPSLGEAGPSLSREGARPRECVGGERRHSDNDHHTEQTPERSGAGVPKEADGDDVGAERAPVEVELADDERDESRHYHDIEG
jgi:hypothetical protein